MHFEKVTEGWVGRIYHFDRVGVGKGHFKVKLLHKTACIYSLAGVDSVGK